jgi:hypothetical protein
MYNQVNMWKHRIQKWKENGDSELYKKPSKEIANGKNAIFK